MLQPLTTRRSVTANIEWLGCPHGTDDTDTITLDIAKFTNGTHYGPSTDTSQPCRARARSRDQGQRPSGHGPGCAESPLTRTGRGWFDGRGAVLGGGARWFRVRCSS